MDFIKYLIKNHNIHLSKQQQAAVLDIEGPILLLAVPGGGKTTVVISRCANMIINHGINPENILTLTFSKASALDMKRRFQEMFSNEVRGKIQFSTIHSFCYSVLRTYASNMKISLPTIIEDEKAPVTKSKILRHIYQKHNNSYINDEKLEELSNSICYVKNMMFNRAEIENYETNIDNFYRIFKNYEVYKQQNNYIDFDDMLTTTLDLFTQNKKLLASYRNKYTYINVDESQDTSHLQHRIIKCLASPRNNIFMVGDEDQSIYSFRAAFPKALLDFEKTYPGAKVYLMEKNYRSTESIVKSANIFIKQNNERYDKNMSSENKKGLPVKYTSLQKRNKQYGYITDILKKEKQLTNSCILYRNNISSIPLIDTLERNNIPFYIREGKNHFFKHWVTTDIISFMNISLDPTNTEAFNQIYYKIDAYLSKKMAQYVTNNANSNRNVFDVLLGHSQINQNQRRKILEVKRNIIKISKLNALDAIDFIVKKVGYGEYLKKQGKEGCNNIDGLMQIISGLKSIAERTESIYDFKHRLIQLQQIIYESRFNAEKNAVTLSTIHSSKGLEFERVFIIDLFDGQFPSASSIEAVKIGDTSLMEEEVRLFYVGATRAKNQLELLTSKSLDDKKVIPSRFIKQFLADNRRIR